MDLIDLGHLLPLVVVGGAFTFAGSVLYGVWLLGRYRGRDEQGAAVLADVESRLHGLEQAVGQATDAIERLEAAHRLTARLLTDGDRRAMQKAVTPH